MGHGLADLQCDVVASIEHARYKTHGDFRAAHDDALHGR